MPSEVVIELFSDLKHAKTISNVVEVLRLYDDLDEDLSSPDKMYSNDLSEPDVRSTFVYPALCP